MKRQNITLWGAGILALILTTAVIYIPFMANAFDFAHISISEYFIALGIAFLIIPMVEFVKIFERLSIKKKN